VTLTERGVSGQARGAVGTAHWFDAGLDGYDAQNGSTALASDDVEGIEANVFRRDFEKRILLVNGTEETVTIDLEQPYHHIDGIVDPTFNDGARNVTSVTLDDDDARFLVRP